MALSNMALVMEKAKPERNTEEFWRKYAAAGELSGTPRLQAVAHHNLGVAALKRKDLAAARVELERAVSLARSVEARTEEAMALVDLAGVAAELGANDKSKQSVDQLVSLLPSVHNEAVQLRCFHKLGRLFRELGDPRAAREYIGRALDISNKMSDKGDLPDLYRDLGGANEGLGDVPAALDAHQKSLAAARVNNDRTGMMFAWCNIGLCHVRLGDRTEAAKAMASAVEAASDIGSPHLPEYQRILATIGDRWQWMGFSAAAREESRRARARYAK